MRLYFPIVWRSVKICFATNQSSVDMKLSSMFNMEVLNISCSFLCVCSTAATNNTFIYTNMLKALYFI